MAVPQQPRKQQQPPCYVPQQQLQKQQQSSYVPQQQVSPSYEPYEQQLVYDLHKLGYDVQEQKQPPTYRPQQKHQKQQPSHVLQQLPSDVPQKQTPSYVPVTPPL